MILHTSLVTIHEHNNWEVTRYFSDSSSKWFLKMGCWILIIVLHIHVVFGGSAPTSSSCRIGQEISKSQSKTSNCRLQQLEVQKYQAICQFFCLLIVSLIHGLVRDEEELGMRFTDIPWMLRSGQQNYEKASALKLLSLILCLKIAFGVYEPKKS